MFLSCSRVGNRIRTRHKHFLSIWLTCSGRRGIGEIAMVTALITLFNPTQKNVENACIIAEQVNRVFLCDNSNDDNSLLFAKCPLNVVYIPYRKNFGLPGAFNRILKDKRFWSDSADDEWVLFFDQDSRVQAGHVQSLIAEFEALRKKNIRVGCLGPIYFDTSSGKVELPRSKRQISEQTYIVSSIITSSMLTTYKTLESVGYWNEALFLDMADWDLCWRIQKSGKESCLTTAVILQHTLGLGRKKVGPLSLKVTNPVREYYQIRDCMYLLKAKYVPLKYKVRFVLMIYVRSYLHVKFLDHSTERRMFIKRAKMDFRKGIHGEYCSNKLL